MAAPAKALSKNFLPRLSDEWTLKWSQKKDLYGKKHLISVGGKIEGWTNMDDEPKVNDRAKDAPEPVCFFSPPIELMEELLHTFFGKMDVDLRAADGKLAFACLQNRVAYLGVTYNEVHSKLLEGLDLCKPAWKTRRALCSTTTMRKPSAS